MLVQALTLSYIGLVAAHTGCGGHDISRRNFGGHLISRQSTVNSTAQSIDPTVECTAYSYQPVMDIKANFPAIWQTASIVSTDTAAQELFATINATVNTKLPGSGPHGTPDGNWTSFTYPPTDTDCWWTYRECTTPANDTGLPADITTMPEPETWGFGFDDGPNCSHNALYDFLQENDQRATMFYIGSNVMDWPLQALRAIRDGHEICVHTWSHQYMTALSNDVVFAELYYTRQAIQQVLGVTPKCWRPPFGDVDNRVRLIAQQLNLTTVVWSDDTDDWKVTGLSNGITPEQVDANYQSIINGAGNGTYATHGPIVLNHELNNYTMSELIKFYPMIKQAFKYIVPISTGFNLTEPYTETNITYPDFSNYTNTTGSSSSSASLASSAASATGPVLAAASSASSSSSTAATTKAASSGSRVGASLVLLVLGLLVSFR